ncbi:MAG: SpoIID/LytB domain-containing protein [Clostridiales Family XIII bacterium]|nr:SpoIID/LytB domain-containing protein [Clostridiales Family XIII bacterium]
MIRFVCALPIAALVISLPMIPGGLSVDTDGKLIPDGSGAVYAADVSSTADHMIRVHLSSLGSPTSFKPTVKGSYTIKDNGKAVSGAITIAASGSTGIKVTAGSTSYSLDKDILLKAANQKVSNYVSISSHNYPGDIRVINKSGKLKIVNHVDMETYVMGVVPYESGNSKERIEAIKSQAVAARSFAYYTMNSRNRNSVEHDVVNTTASQVYQGYSSDYKNANAAVVATACQVLLSPKGEGVYTCYSASNGGHTEYPKSSGASSTNFKHLPFKEDPYDLKFSLANANYNASVTIPKTLTASDLKTNKKQPYAMLRSAMKSAGVDPDNLPADTSVSVKKIALTCPRYTDNSTPRVYTGADFTLGVPKMGTTAARDIIVKFTSYVDGRKIKRPFLNDKLGLSDKTKFSRLYLRSDSKSYLLASVRFGHSAGMSQVGAYQMAMDGKSYKDILTFYYLMGSETKLVTKNWPIDNGVTSTPVSPGTEVDTSADTSAPTEDDSAEAPAFKVTEYSATGSLTSPSMLNVRSGPATTYQVIGAMKKDDKVTITGKSGNWYRIKYGTGLGYVSKQYVKITKTVKKSAYPFKGKVKIKSGKLTIRSGAGTKYKNLGSLKKNKTVTIKGAKGSWYRITYKGKNAYILKTYIKKI